MTADSGLFAGTGNISIRSAGRTDLTTLSLSGNLEVTGGQRGDLP